MSFSGAFSIGLAGVNAYATSLQTISENIANSQTTGFKRARTDFADLIATPAADGGISGGGVTANARIQLNEQGGVVRTNSETDLALLGEGYFVVSETADGNPAEEPLLFTRSGGFTTDQNGNLVNAAGYYLRGTPITDGAAPNLAGGLNSLQTVNINAVSELFEPTDAISLRGNLSADAITGETVNRSLSVIDADGTTQTLITTFFRTAGGQWFGEISDSVGTQLGQGEIVFDSNGRFNAEASGFPTQIQQNTSTFSIDASALTSITRATDLTSSTTDGARAAPLSGIEISGNGIVSARFANGLSRDLFLVPIATFRSDSALERGADSTYRSASSDDIPVLNAPGSERAGAIESAALEISTVDIAQEFSALIETQRAYSANTRVITVADELWRTLTQTAR
ncbi:MAG: flagellar hook-basal body complex protein [Pseudomonadota bacterium]